MCLAPRICKCYEIKVINIFTLHIIIVFSFLTLSQRFNILWIAGWNKEKRINFRYEPRQFYYRHYFGQEYCPSCGCVNQLRQGMIHTSGRVGTRRKPCICCQECAHQAEYFSPKRHFRLSAAQWPYVTIAHTGW